MTQYQLIARLLRRKTGCTAMDIIREAHTTAPHKRMSEMRYEKGWTIWRKEIPGCSHGRYFGHAPSEPCYFDTTGAKHRKELERHG